jgi:hypothetical protein
MAAVVTPLAASTMAGATALAHDPRTWGDHVIRDTPRMIPFVDITDEQSDSGS